jgi:hypothetical protein
MNAQALAGYCGARQLSPVRLTQEARVRLWLESARATARPTAVSPNWHAFLAARKEQSR